MVYVGRDSRITLSGVVVSNWSSADNKCACLPSQQLTGKVVGFIQALFGRLVVFVGIYRNCTFDQLGDSVVDAFLESFGHRVTSRALLKDVVIGSKSFGALERGERRGVLVNRFLP